MRKPMTLPELIQEHFDGVLDTIEGGRWGQWVLDRDRLGRGDIVLVHEVSGLAVSAAATDDWMSRIAGAGCATVDDVGDLVFAIRDLEYARWLGVLPGSRLSAAGAGTERSGATP